MARGGCNADTHAAGGSHLPPPLPRHLPVRAPRLATQGALHNLFLCLNETILCGMESTDPALKTHLSKNIRENCASSATLLITAVSCASSHPAMPAATPCEVAAVPLSLRACKKFPRPPPALLLQLLMIARLNSALPAALARKVSSQWPYAPHAHAAMVGTAAHMISSAFNLQSVDKLLWKWDAAYSRLLRAEAHYEAGGCAKRPTHRAERCGGPGDALFPFSHPPSRSSVHPLSGPIRDCCKCLFYATPHARGLYRDGSGPPLTQTSLGPTQHARTLRANVGIALHAQTSRAQYMLQKTS